MVVLTLTDATFKLEEIDPVDLLSAAQTIPAGELNTVAWLNHWIPATTYLDWARRGLENGDEYGWSNAMMYAKRAAANRIDVLLRYNHLAPFSNATYDEKAKALRTIGIEIPEDVIRDLVFDPRNKAEHEYKPPEYRAALHAWGIANLFVRATEAEWNGRGDDNTVGDRTDRRRHRSDAPWSSDLNSVGRSWEGGTTKRARRRNPAMEADLLTSVTV